MTGKVSESNSKLNRIDTFHKGIITNMCPLEHGSLREIISSGQNKTYLTSNNRIEEIKVQKETNLFRGSKLRRWLCISHLPNSDHESANSNCR